MKHEFVNVGYKDLKSITNESGRRYFTPDDISYPSITTILGVGKEESLQKWVDRVGQEEADRVSHAAAWRGSQVHDLLEKYVLKEKINLPPNPLIRDGYHKIRKVLDQHVDKIYGVEVPLYSDHLRVAGRADLIASFNGKRSIVDYKTSNRIKEKHWIESYFIQETFYAIAWEERTGQPITQLVTIIANDEDIYPQIFIEHRDRWVDKLKHAIEKYCSHEMMKALEGISNGD